MLINSTNDSQLGDVAMDHSSTLFTRCPRHGKPTKRRSCSQCNAAYMRGYLRRRRLATPGRALWDRALKRAKSRSISFSLPRNSVFVPPSCPALGIPLEVRSCRTASSPSLDRIVPHQGYVPGNVRVISDRANRLKGDRTLAELRQLAALGSEALRPEYTMIATYVEREQLLAEVRDKAQQGGRPGTEWAKVADLLDRAFSKSLVN